MTKLSRLIAGAIVLALSASPVAAQTGQGSSPLSIVKGGTGAASASAARSALGLAIGSAVQAWDADLDALAALSGTDTIYRRSGAATWSAVTIGGLLSFSGGTLNVGDAELVALAGLTSAADKCAYFTGSGTAALTDCPSFGRSLMNAASASAARTTLGLVIGTDVQAQDAELAALAGLTSANNKCFYWTGTGTAATFDCSSFGRGLVNASGAAAARASSQLNVDSFTGHGDSDYSIVATDRVVGTNAAFTASRTWTLPAANAVNAGQSVLVADFFGTVTGSNTLVIARAGSDTINGSTSVTISVGNGAVILWSDGSSKWTAQAIGATGTTGVSSVGGLTGAVGVANGLDVSGSNVQLTAARRTLPTVQTFTSSSGTYNRPSNVLWIEVLLIGGGGGGSGSGGNGGNGGDTCWNTSGAACTTPVYSAGGGKGSAGSGVGGLGGTVAGSSSCTTSAAGGDGGGSAGVAVAGATGGSSSLAGGGTGGAAGGSNTGKDGKANTGSGAGGGSAASAGYQGGGAGATCYVVIGSPASSYTYAVGAGGSAGSGGGGVGGTGYIRVIEHYGS